MHGNFPFYSSSNPSNFFGKFKMPSFNFTFWFVRIRIFLPSFSLYFGSFGFPVYFSLCSAQSLLERKNDFQFFPAAAIPAVQTVQSAWPCNQGILRLLSEFYP